MILAFTALQWPYPGGKASVELLVRHAAHKEFYQARELACSYLVRIQQEINYAHDAVNALERWSNNQPAPPLKASLKIRDASKLLGISMDALRNWERNGLISIPRGQNSYREYNEPEISLLRVIRTLRQAGYSLLSILRTIHHLKIGPASDLKELIGNPPEDENVITAADRWLATLENQKIRAEKIITQIDKMILKYPSQ